MRLSAQGIFGLALILVVAAAGLVSLFCTSLNPLGINLGTRLQPPSLQNLFGTDEFGRDVFSRAMVGARTSLLMSVGFAVAVGTFVGIAAGHSRGVVDRILGLVARYADDVVVLRRGDMVETGAARRILAAPAHDYTRALIDALPRRREAESGVASAGPDVISGKGIEIEYPSTGLFSSEPPLKVVHGVDITIRSGEIVALVGGSGSGKTTLGRSLIGLLPHSAGRVSFKGQVMDGAGAELKRRYRLDCQLIFQDPYSSLDPRYRVAEIVGEPLRHVPGLSREERRSRVAQMLEEVGLRDFARRYPNAMSGGQGPRGGGRGARRRRQACLRRGGRTRLRARHDHPEADSRTAAIAAGA